MPNIIPVPVAVSFGVGDQSGQNVRNFGSMNIVPYATTRHGGLEIVKWLILDRDGETCDLNERMILEALPQKLLMHICRYTFETDIESLPLVVTIDDETWTFPMRARELEYEEVHYEIELEYEWTRISEIYVSDVVGEDQTVFAERSVLPSIDFGSAEAVYSEMG